MPWNEGLLPQQIDAASHVGQHGRLLAGPGTGKTLVLTRRVVYLVNERNVDPSQIVALTFTRAAARELKQRIEGELGRERLPRVTTLHSFSLRQLLRNAHRLDTLPQPLRIADDWEERYIILENLRTLLGHRRIKDTRELLSRLASDWESLAADEPGWAPDPAFLGTWRQHREVFGYTLRSELTYQLKRALEQVQDFQIDSPITHLLVDEYQDLNRCDLAVIRGIAAQGSEVFVAGDDDQSIYWFRKAHPEGIRQFPNDYAGARDLPLEICKRCDPEILRLAEFVAALDPDRIPKRTRAEDGRIGGEVKLLRFSNQVEEAEGLARLARYFIQTRGVAPQDILILLRVDTRSAYSNILVRVFADVDVQAAASAQEGSPLDTDPGRILLSYLRLLGNPNDDLSLYQLLKLRQNHIGDETLTRLYDLARNGGIRFSQAAEMVQNDPTRIDRSGQRVQTELANIRHQLQQLQDMMNVDPENQPNISDQIRALTEAVVPEHDDRTTISEYLGSIARSSEVRNISELLSSLQSENEDIEQELVPNCVNILSMHKAKGLTASVVFIPVAEDEHMPGNQEANPGLGDERRLLFVSLTRAKHHLFISYCTRRTGQQRQLGRNSSRLPRSLTRFLRDAPVRPEDGTAFTNRRVQQ